MLACAVGSFFEEDVAAELDVLDVPVVREAAAASSAALLAALLALSCCAGLAETDGDFVFTLLD